MNNCAVIKDLLPLFADNVLSQESKELVSQHLASCENCKNEYANMQTEIKMPLHANDAKILVLKAMKKKIFRQKIVSAVVTCMFALAAVIVINNFIIVNAHVASPSMGYTVQSGDRIVAFRGSYLFRDPRRYDIVIFRGPPGDRTLYVKRILGLPGETLIIIDGHVYINGSAAPQRYDFVMGPLTGDYGIYNPETGELEPFVIPEGHYFMLADYRAIAVDSRRWDEIYVPRERIMGRVVFRYFPFAKLRGR